MGEPGTRPEDMLYLRRHLSTEINHATILSRTHRNKSAQFDNPQSIKPNTSPYIVTKTKHIHHHAHHHFVTIHTMHTILTKTH